MAPSSRTAAMNACQSPAGACCSQLVCSDAAAFLRGRDAVRSSRQIGRAVSMRHGRYVDIYACGDGCVVSRG
ncbi:hypothetical protein E2562_033809 [Oryza meyeriana var. granulata]|uniref:Uncharacterized protein n=1 Tax=Oryza meyeriana var. granulata TaxID=110450 RepID=A0A6G1F1B4_9ORYZ|nr:hypothetical protein E2562_033809 [Oryza meyeriana var. granulata]